MANNVDYIKDDYQIGDSIRISCSLGIKEGTIVAFFENRIKLQPYDKAKKPISVDASTITDWEEGAGSPSPYPQSVNQNVPNSNEKQTDSNVKAVAIATNCDVAKFVGQSELSSNSETDSDNSVTRSGASCYKPGDVIPLEELQKIDPNSVKPKIQKNKVKLTPVIGGFVGLSSLVEEQHLIDNDKFVPAIGEIDLIFTDRNFGFVRDSYGKQIYFSTQDIVDCNIKRDSSCRRTPVVFSIKENYKGEVACCIHKPQKVAELLALSKELAQKGEIVKAIDVLDHILNEFPDNYSADSAKKELMEHVPQNVHKQYSALYAKAKKYEQDKKFDLALDCYFKTLQKGQKEESCIKDIASIYASLYRAAEEGKKEYYREKVMTFLSQNENKLPATLSSWQHLENIYYSVGDFENFFRVADILLDDKNYTKSLAKQTSLLAKKAAAYIQLNELEKALEIVEEVLSLSPSNLTAQKLKDVITKKEQGIEVDDVVSETDFESLTSGMSPYIKNTLDEYEDYDGVPAKVIESGDFNEVTLRSIRSLIETAGRARARERAKYLLTECKLMLTIEPNEEIKLRSEIARYCNAMALNSISENSPSDIIRFFYLEAFSLEESYDKVGTQVALYLLTHCISNRELLNSNTRSPSVSNALAKLFSNGFDLKRWESVLSMFLQNRRITAILTPKLYKDYLKPSLSALSQWGIDIADNPTQEEYTAAWNSVREKRISDYRRVIASIKSMADYNSIDQAIGLLLDSLRKCKDESPWLCSLDINRINNLINNICPAIENYVNSSGYRNKERDRNNAKGQIRQLVDEIKSGPTKISFEAILPLVQQLDRLIDDSFDNVIKTSEPKLQLMLLSGNNVVDSNNNVALQVSISNDKNSSPISEVSVCVTPSEEVDCVNSDNTLYNAIEGGDSHIFRLQIKVSERVKEDKATALNILCRYKNGEEYKQYEEQVSLKLYSADDFVAINNPYAPIADGGPVPTDSSMFFGRNTFIANIVDAIIHSQSKQIIIYGQKRCGKSSVMLHLKKSLQETGKTFCIFFSLGDILNNLTEASFYHKILSSIQDELDNLEFDGEVVPSISFPNISNFRDEDPDNPLNTFTKYMSKFKRVCKSTEGWADKNLVVMIDEFTYLYTGIKKGQISDSIMKQWKAITQNEKAQFSVVLVGQDVVPSFKKEDYARNAFGVIQDMRLTYLQEEPARELIEKPILNEDGKSRYIGNAVSRIIEYTSRNPYYIQIFCTRLVDYMNKNKSITVTEADVNDVARSFVVGDQSLEEDKFDNLIRAGETEDLQEFPESDILAMLRQIAFSSKNIGYCCIDDIDVLGDKEREYAIVKHLVDREVLEQKGDNNYRIQVRLFQEWLINH